MAYDVVIAGGGLAGQIQAAALGNSGWRIAVLERGDGQKALSDPRNLALSESSRRILEALGIWCSVQADSVPITHIDVSRRGAFGTTCLRAADEGLPALGYVIAASRLSRALRGHLEYLPKCDFFTQTKALGAEMRAKDMILKLLFNGTDNSMRTRLLVIADGARSQLRENLGLHASLVDYGQSAVATEVGMDRAANGWAYERFSESGPMALLPSASGKRALVWAQTHRQASRLWALSDAQFYTELQSGLGARAGQVRQVGERHLYRLQFYRTDQRVGERCVLMGDAAYSFHPVAAQGFNLVIRDAAWLAQRLSGMVDPGAASLLEQYAHDRAEDARRVAGFTDALALGFSLADPMTRGLQALGFAALESFPEIRTRLIRFGMGVDLPQPDLVLGRR